MKPSEYIRGALALGWRIEQTQGVRWHNEDFTACCGIGAYYVTVSQTKPGNDLPDDCDRTKEYDLRDLLALVVEGRRLTGVRAAEYLERIEAQAADPSNVRALLDVARQAVQR